MYLFYVLMILAGVICVSLSMFMLMIDRRKAIELSDNLESKKEDIIDVINDAEQIVVEMNNFSDYLFEKIDSKAKEIEKILENSQRQEMEKVDERLEYINENEKLQVEVEEIPKLNVVNGTNLQYYTKPFTKALLQVKESTNIDILVDKEEVDINEVLSIGSEKIIPINPKHKNVYTLFEKGYSEVEIAKMLRLGLGEIKLILGVKR